MQFVVLFLLLIPTHWLKQKQQYYKPQPPKMKAQLDQQVACWYNVQDLVQDFVFTGVPNALET